MVYDEYSHSMTGIGMDGFENDRLMSILEYGESTVILSEHKYTIYRT